MQVRPASTGLDPAHDTPAGRRGAAGQETEIRSSTDLTPGTDHAARSAVWRSLMWRTCPDRITCPESTVILMPEASSSASRRNAFSIRSCTSDGLKEGLIEIALVRP